MSGAALVLLCLGELTGGAMGDGHSTITVVYDNRSRKVLPPPELREEMESPSFPSR